MEGLGILVFVSSHWAQIWRKLRYCLSPGGGDGALGVCGLFPLFFGLLCCAGAQAQNPALVTHLSGTASPNFLNAPEQPDVLITAGHTYVIVPGCGNANGDISVINVDNPASPSTIGHTTIAAGACGAQVKIDPRGNGYAYVPDWGGRWYVLNLSTPSSPSISLTENSAHPGTVQMDTYQAGGSTYVVFTNDVNVGSTYIEIWEVTTPLAPVLKSSNTHLTNYNGFCGTITVVGHYAMVSCGDVPYTLFTIDIADLSSPSVVATNKFCSTIQNASSCVVGGSIGPFFPTGQVYDGRYLYVTSYDQASLYIIDLGGGHSPTSPALVSLTCAVGSLTACIGSGADGLWINPSGTNAYVYRDTNMTLYVLDTSNKLAPSVIGHNTSPFGSGTYHDNHAQNTLTAANGDLFVVSTTNNTLNVVSTVGLSSTAMPCDVNQDGSVNVVDVQLIINEALGVTSCTSTSIAGSCDVTAVQRVINAALGQPCNATVSTSGGGSAGLVGN